MSDPRASAEREGLRAPLPRLVTDLLRNVSDLIQLEIALFKQEMGENLSRLFMGIAMLVIGAVFAIAGLLLLVDAFVDWLAVVVGSAWLASLLTGAGLLLIALAFLLAGRSMTSMDRLRPNRTVRSVRRDAQMFSEKVS